MRHFIKYKYRWVYPISGSVLVLLLEGGCEFGTKGYNLPADSSNKRSNVCKNEIENITPTSYRSLNAQDPISVQDLVDLVTYKRSRYLVHLYQQIGYAVWSMLHSDAFCCAKHATGNGKVYQKMNQYGKKLKHLGQHLLIHTDSPSKKISHDASEAVCFREQLVQDFQDLFEQTYQHIEAQAKKVWTYTGLPQDHNFELIFWKKLKSDLTKENFIQNFEKIKDNRFMENAQSLDLYVNDHVAKKFKAFFTEKLKKEEIRLNQAKLESLARTILLDECTLRNAIIAKLEKNRSMITKKQSAFLHNKHKWVLGVKRSQSTDSGFTSENKNELIFLFTDYTKEILQFFCQKIQGSDKSVLSVLADLGKTRYKKLQEVLDKEALSQDQPSYQSTSKKEKELTVKQKKTLKRCFTDDAEDDIDIDQRNVDIVDSYYMLLESLCKILSQQYQALTKDKPLLHHSFWESLQKIQSKLNGIQAQNEAMDQILKKEVRDFTNEDPLLQQQALDHLHLVKQRIKILAKEDLINQLLSHLQSDAFEEGMQSYKGILEGFDFQQLNSMYFTGGAELFSLFKKEVKHTGRRKSFTGSAPTMVALSNHLPNFLPSDDRYQYIPYVKDRPVTHLTKKKEITASVINDIKQEAEELQATIQQCLLNSGWKA